MKKIMNKNSEMGGGPVAAVCNRQGNAVPWRSAWNTGRDPAVPERLKRDWGVPAAALPRKQQRANNRGQSNATETTALSQDCTKKS